MTRHIYDYDVDLKSDTAPAHVIRLTGRNRRVLEVGDDRACAAIASPSQRTLLLEQSVQAVRVHGGPPD